RFWFRIRATPVPFDENCRRAERQSQSQSPASNQVPRAHPRFCGRVLVVEDNPVNRKVVDLLLKKYGLSVLYAEDGQQCVDMITQRRVPHLDLVLMDIQMPVLDGYQATQRIR
ncbi:MAG: response regulator, partial [Rhodoferax sp.]|nr:response regulator [Rhodoferax sp.]